jgi:hypothetical protein
MCGERRGDIYIFFFLLWFSEQEMTNVGGILRCGSNGVLILRQLKEKRNFRKRVKIEEKAGYFSLFFFRQACPAHHNSTRAE